MYRNFSHNFNTAEVSPQIPQQYEQQQQQEVSIDEMSPPTTEFDTDAATVGSGRPVTIEEKLNLMSFNNSWNDNNEKMIVSLGENAASYKWMHEKCASKYLFYNKVMNVTLTVFNTGLSAQTLVSENNQAVVIASKVFIYLVTLLSVLMNFLKYQDLAAKHTQAASKFGQLYHDIQQQMCLYRKDRKEAVGYIQEILKLYDSLIVGGPEILDSVLSEFKAVFKNAEISVPEIADRIRRIDIISEPAAVAAAKSKRKKLQFKLPERDARAHTAHSRKDSLGGGLQRIHELSCSLQINDDITDDDIRNRSKEMYEMERYRKHLDATS